MDTKHIHRINFHLGNDEGSFLFSLYEKRVFDTEKYNELICSIKRLNKMGVIYILLENRFDECIGYNFISNLIGKLYLLMNIENDIREYDEHINISREDFSTYIEQLVFELESLFAKWESDYNGNMY